MPAKAGNIVFDITGDNSKLRSVLQDSKGHAMRAGQAIGAAMTAAGAAITGFAVLSVRDYAAAGDEIQKMALKTGFTTEKLSELKHAAELGGTNLATIGKASKTLSKNITEAGDGTATYVDALALVGLTYEDLQAQNPQEQFMTTAMALAEVENQTTRAAAAQLIFGRAGVDMLPMLAEGKAGIDAAAQAARDLGLIFDQEAADGAAQFTDAQKEMIDTLRALSFDVAAALLPTLIELMGWVRENMVAFNAWRDANEGLFGAITKITVVIGGIMTVLGPLLIMLPGLVSAFGILKGAIGLVVAAFGLLAGAVSAPVAIIVAAVGAIALAGATLYNYWAEVKTFLISIWQGIAAAFEFIFAPLFWAWEKLQGIALDAQRMLVDAGNAGAQAAQIQSQGANVGQGGGSGGGPLGTVTNHFHISGSGRDSSQQIAEILQGELSQRGFA